MKIVKKFIYLLTPQEIRKATFLFFMILVMAILDIIGIASILPFMTVLTNPEIIETNNYLNEIFEITKEYGIKNIDQFIFFLGISVFVILIFSLTFKAITTYFQVRFVEMRQYSIGKRLVENYLKQPYSWFLNRNSADIGKTVLSEVGQIVAGGLNPFIDLIAKSMIVISIVLLLIITDPKLALMIMVSLGGFYWIIFFILRKFIDKIGKQRLKSNELRFLSISEAFGASKEIKLGGLENIYLKRFSYSAQSYALASAYAQAIRQIPRFILEAIAFGGILLLILYLFIQKGSFGEALPIISLYVFAGYRLMPALQNVYGSFTQLTFVGPSLNKLYNDLNNLKNINQLESKSIIPLNENIILENINYNYPNSSKKTLSDISLKIPAKTTVGFIGATGSGKTTTVDIILGLLEPQKGSLKIDNTIINKKNLRSWQSKIGYVPQHIYLADDTIAANIAFGEDPKKMNYEIIDKVSKIANINDFINNELPNKYQTIIGERGVRLSGGQRQRIGIARALYNDPEILVMDEATSALDNDTEQAVMEAIKKLSNKLTIILIAHRLRTVKICDIIFKFEKGKLINSGKFNDLIGSDY